MSWRGGTGGANPACTLPPACRQRPRVAPYMHHNLPPKAPHFPTASAGSPSACACCCVSRHWRARRRSSLASVDRLAWACDVGHAEPGSANGLRAYACALGQAPCIAHCEPPAAAGPHPPLQRRTAAGPGAAASLEAAVPPATRLWARPPYLERPQSLLGHIKAPLGTMGRFSCRWAAREGLGQRAGE